MILGFSWDSPKHWEDKALAEELQRYFAGKGTDKRYNIYAELCRGVRSGVMAGNLTELEMLAEGAYLRNFGSVKQEELRRFLQSRKHAGPFE
jgi:hypothetical protein